jgi:hypothetical protein
MTTPPRDIVFLDVETNGRYVERGHVAWDVAAWNLTTGHRVQFFTHIPDMARFLGTSEPKALKVSGFLDRYPLDGPCPTAQHTRDGVAALREVLDGGREGNRAEMLAIPAPVIVGSKPTFDMGFVRALAIANRHPDPEADGGPWWHHHPIDLGAYAAGVLAVEPGTESLSAESVARLCHVEPGGHSAAGDVTSGGRCFLLLREVARLSRFAAAPGTPRDTLALLIADGLTGAQVEGELLKPTAPVA